MPINKVVFGSTTLIDISDTTAVASDVAQGKYFYTAAGVKTAGTASGGGSGSAYQDENGYIVLDSEDSGSLGYTVDDVGYILVNKKQLVLNWDLTQSLTDTIGGKTITLYNDAVQDSNGITISAANQYALFTGMRRALYRTYEFDIKSFVRANGAVHHRFIMFSTDHGLIYRNSGYWAYYSNPGGWATNSTSNSQSILNEKTLKLEIRPDGDYWYIDNEFWYKPSLQNTYITGASIFFGSSGNSCMNAVMTGARMYVGFDT